MKMWNVDEARVCFGGLAVFIALVAAGEGGALEPYVSPLWCAGDAACLVPGAVGMSIMMSNLALGYFQVWPRLGWWWYWPAAALFPLTWLAVIAVAGEAPQ